MNKSKNIFLFGAGAMIDWNGPTTSELTKRVREIGFPISTTKQKLTDYIYKRLLENGYDEEDVNFETIINAIEELSVYYSDYNGKKQTPSLLRSFLGDNVFEKIFDFSIEGGKRKHGYKLQIPKGKDYPFCSRSYNDENPTQFYLQHVLSEILTGINGRISEYAYDTNSHSVINKDSTLSQDFKKWISSKERANLLRMYSLNYDRIFKILLKDIGIECFEGFNSTGNVSDMEGIRCDVPRILKNLDSNIFYNLHGSAFWKVLAKNGRQLPEPEIVYTGTPNLPANDDLSNVRIEKGKPLYLTNIITGYQKAQKSMISPFKQMHFAFDRDCFVANKIYIIGYSFGDEHINECIKIALRHNENLILEIIDPNFIKNKFDEKLLLTLFQYIENDHIYPKKIGNNKFSYYSDRIIVYTLKFGEYLKVKSS